MLNYEILVEDSTGELVTMIKMTEVREVISTTECYRVGVSRLEYSGNVDVETYFLCSLDKTQQEMYFDFCKVLVAFDRKEIYPVDRMAIKNIISKVSKELGMTVRSDIDIKYAENDIDEDKYKDNGKSKNNVQKPKKKNKKKISFKDIVGMEEVKEKLNDVIDQFNNKEKYEEWNIDPIQGILLHGPSGTGKSFISEALANEIDAKFIKVSSGDIMDKYIGGSGKNIKKVFEKARSHNGPAIIYIDEIDFVASKRGSSDNDKERNAALNELLVQMASPDNDNVFMIFATNRLELLDPAFLRSGRCDFKIEVPLPDFESRKEMLELYSKGRPIDEDVDFERIARNMSGMNCADVKHIANESARRALKAKKESIEQIDFDEIFEEMICGSSSKTKKLDEKDKEVVSIHEAGHLIANEIYRVNKTKKISILPRGSALGYVLHANEDENDKYLYTKEELMNRIKVCLAGRAAEELVFDSITTGASNDLEKANDIAMNYICKYGFTEDNGLLVLNRDDLIAKNKVSRLVKSLLELAYEDTIYMLESNKDILFAISEKLKEKEELNGEEVEEILSQFNIDKRIQQI